MAGFLDGFFANSPDDPRYGANMALFASMMQGNLPAGVAGYADALQRGRAAVMQNQLGQLNLRKGQLELTDLERKIADDQATRDVLAQFARGQQATTPASTAAPGAPVSGMYGSPPQTGATMEASPSQVSSPAGGTPASAGAGGASTGGPQASARGNSWQLYQRMGDALSAKGLATQAQGYYALADKFRPQYGTEPRVMMGPDGKLVNVLVASDGSTQVLPFGVKPNMKTLDLGGTMQAVDENSLTPGATFTKTQTPDSRASNALGWANYGVSKDRLAFEQSKQTQDKIPTGYRLAADGRSLEFIPGGPADPEAARRASPTEWQGKSLMFGARAQQADKILGGLEQSGAFSPAGINFKQGVESTPLIGQPLGAAANMVLSPNSQRAEQAQRDFVNAVLRLESGAAISQSEFDNARKQYFPQPGDSAAVIAQKQANRAQAIKGLLANARPGSLDAMTAPPATAPAASGWSIQRVN